MTPLIPRAVKEAVAGHGVVGALIVDDRLSPGCPQALGLRELLLGGHLRLLDQVGVRQ
jgi:hypothetical protein